MGESSAVKNGANSQPISLLGILQIQEDNLGCRQRHCDNSVARPSSGKQLPCPSSLLHVTMGFVWLWSEIDYQRKVIGFLNCRTDFVRQKLGITERLAAFFIARCSNLVVYT